MFSYACCVPNCNQKYVPVFRFPSPASKSEWYQLMFRIWAHRTGCTELFKDLTADQIHNKYRVCGAHFIDECRIPNTHLLKKESLPTLLLPNFSGEANIINSFMTQLVTKTPDSEELRILGGIFAPTDDVITTKSSSQSSPPSPQSSPVQAVDDSITNEINNSIEENLPPYFASVHIVATTGYVCEVCRICLLPVQEDNIVTLHDDQTDLIATILPDLDLSIYPNAIICNKCNDFLESSLHFRRMWYMTENTLKAFVKNQQRNSDLLLIENETDKDHDYVIKPLAEIHRNFAMSPNEYRELLWGSGPFLCELCGAVYDKRVAFRLHVFRHKRKLKKLTQQAMCEICGEIFPNVMELRKHKHVKEPKPKIPPVLKYCQHCAKTFTTTTSLAYHIKSLHLGIKDWRQCHICGKKLVGKNSLRFHMISHMEERPFQCDTCGKKFRIARHLKRHKMRHTEKRYKCEFCGNILKHAISLKKHVKIYHTGQDGHKCEDCDKRYWKKCDLIKHRVQKHGSVKVETVTN